MKKLLIRILVLLMLSTAVGLPAHAAEEKKAPLGEKTLSAIVIERDTGEVIFEKNSNKSLPPASMTKIMTMLLIMEAIDEGKLKYEDQVSVSEYAASMGGSQIFLEAGEQMSVDDMLKGIAVASGNDAAVAMAEHLAGSEEAFVKMMNEKASELNLEQTSFKNTNGLPVDNHYSSAHDLAIIAKELLKYEKITDYTSIYEDYLRKGTDKEFWLVNTNKLVRFYPGVDGLKTGFTQEAKYGLTATAEKDGMRVIAVVMGAPTSKERNAEVTSLLDHAFNQYSTETLFKKGDTLGEAKVVKGEQKRIEAITDDQVSILLKKGEEAKEPEVTVALDEHVAAPIEKGDVVGSLTVQLDGDTVVSTDLIAAESVDTASWWQLFKRTLSTFAGK
ncbi:D-alanyl-D-alanine carboxypeptidase family protein [Shouchella sp. JSM 1781072]|uniref:D-alanyl-D-alanine carboxypeptidase family protein n=1 Tax=Bacillaceae TaxID=186817 RepID=UPI0020D1AB84|nr:D-alanyl-D-alanine carboxypeptidase family protein [Alkalihalobacillus sp. LMS6]UTR08071.1 D-alanyl-D-alanine carboxypeptidase [Alkalihalobacillus sp. LMS6]